MDEEKKKRKNKKKKNKQNKTTEDVSSAAGDLASHDQNRVAESQEGTKDIAEVQNNDAAKIGIDSSRDLSTNAVATLAEGDKQFWVDREAIYEEKIKQLEKEKEGFVQKEAILEENIKQLLSEKSETLHKESMVEERIRQLENETIAHIHKGASMEETVFQLQKEKDILLQQLAVLEFQISQLQNEKDSWLQQEAGYEGKISLLGDEAATLNLKRVRLEEKIKQMEEERETWIQRENFLEKTISSLDADNAFLQAQVKELEEFRYSSTLENQLLKETVTTLQSQVQDLEKSTHSSTGRKMHTSENGDASSEIEAAHAVVEKLIAENSELVEKVNELCSELQRRGAMKEVSSSSSSDSATTNSESTYNTDNSNLGLDLKAEMAEGHEIKNAVESTKDVHVNEKAEMNGHYDIVNAKDDSTHLHSPEIEVSEIVQIPLDENEAKEVTESEVISFDQKTEVPLTDAPLIGAPFRLISFMARYVSGADLVDKNSAR